jgi:hypothetical protein
MASDAGIRIFASFILGLPGETRQTLRATAEFAKSLGCQYGFHVLSPFPGTRLREEADRFGIRILTDRWDQYDANHVVTLTPGLSPSDVEEILEEYDAGIAAYCGVQEEHFRQGTAPPQERYEVWLRGFKPVAWEILRKDLVEKHGRVNGPVPPAQALPLLAERLARHLTFPAARVREALELWVQEGVLRADPAGEGHRWRWARNDELAFPPQGGRVSRS